MGNLKPIHATITQEDVISGRRKITETPQRLQSQTYYRTVDGIVTVVHANGSCDVKVPGRPFPYTEVFCILPGVKLEVSQGCTLGFLENAPNLPMIIAAKFVGAHKGAPVAIALALWGQAEGTPYLSRSVPSSLINPFSGTAADLWTGTAVATATPFGALVAANEIIITAQGLRDSGNTFWEKIRLSLQIPLGAVTNYEATAATSPAFWYTAMWTNSDASFVLAVDVANRQIWRKRESAFEQITLTDLASFDLVVMSVSPLGHVFLPSYSRTAAQTYTVTAPYTNPAGTTIVDGISTPTGSDKCRAWNTNIAGTTVARAWEYDPASALQSASPVVNGLLYGATGNGQAPCSIYGDAFVTWASGRPRLPAVTNYSQASLVRFNPVASNVPTGYSIKVSQSVEGVLVYVSATAGTPTWTHRITVDATEPSDYGLLGPLDTWMSSNFPSIMGASYSYLGVAGHQALVANVAPALGATVLSNTYFPGSTLTFNAPDYQVFFDAAIVMLPRETANTTKPRDIGGSLNNIGVFTDYVQPGVLGTIDQTLGVVGDKDGNLYFAYLEPVGLKVSGTVGIGGFGTSMGVSNGCWGGLISATTITTGPNTYGGYLLPDMVNTYRRRLRKVSKSGALLLNYDLSQLLTASWYELESALWSGLSSTPVGGSSTANAVPMADNVWKIVPCGRVVFLIIDYHVLGANYQPATQLQVLDANSATILHTVELINDLGLGTLASDIYATASTTEYFTGDGATDTFTLAETPTTVISATVDGAPESYTQAGADIVFDTAPGSGLDIAIEYEYTDTSDLVWRAGERRYAADPLTCELRAGFSTSGSEWAAVEVQRTDRSGASSPAAKTFLVEIQATLTSTPALTIGNATGAGRATISNGSVLQPVYSGGNWKIRQTS